MKGWARTRRGSGRFAGLIEGPVRVFAQGAIVGLVPPARAEGGSRAELDGGLGGDRGLDGGLGSGG
jgi:hypothetical protein